MSHCHLCGRSGTLSSIEFSFSGRFNEICPMRPFFFKYNFRHHFNWFCSFDFILSEAITFSNPLLADSRGGCHSEHLWGQNVPTEDNKFIDCLYQDFEQKLFKVVGFGIEGLRRANDLITLRMGCLEQETVVWIFWYRKKKAPLENQQGMSLA